MFVVFSLLLASLAASAREGPVAFREVRIPRPVPRNLLDVAVLRTRNVELNAALFQAPSAQKLAGRKIRDAAAYSRVVMNFFPDAVLVVRWTSAEENQQGAIVWTGSVEGARLGHAVLILTGSSVVGNMTRGDGKLYQIRTMDDGAVWLLEVDQGKFPPEASPRAAGDRR